MWCDLFDDAGTSGETATCMSDDIKPGPSDDTETSTHNGMSGNIVTSVDSVRSGDVETLDVRGISGSNSISELVGTVVFGSVVARSANHVSGHLSETGTVRLWTGTFGIDVVRSANQVSGQLVDWTVWQVLEEDMAVVVITDVVITESVVAAAVVPYRGTAVNGPHSSNGIDSPSSSSWLLVLSWWLEEDFTAYKETENRSSV